MIRIPSITGDVSGNGPSKKTTSISDRSHHGPQGTECSTRGPDGTRRGDGCRLGLSLPSIQRKEPGAWRGVGNIRNWGGKGGPAWPCVLLATPVHHSGLKDTKGQRVLDHVCNHLDLLERDYFCLHYRDNDGQTHWVDVSRPLVKQLKCSPPYVLSFRVRFYPADALALREEISRYLLFLQLKRDLRHGHLLAPAADMAWLIAFILQADTGDYDPEECTDDREARVALLPPAAHPSLLTHAHDLHRTQLRGQTPAQAEENFLQKVQELETYGFNPQPCRDVTGMPVLLGFTPPGLSVLQDGKRVIFLPWSEIRKLKFEGKTFHVHCVEKEKRFTLPFHAASPTACKHVWRSAVDSQAFYQ